MYTLLACIQYPVSSWTTNGTGKLDLFDGAASASETSGTSFDQHSIHEVRRLTRVALSGPLSIYSKCLRRNRIAVMSCRVQLPMPTAPTLVYREWLFGNDVIKTVVPSAIPSSADGPAKRRRFFGDGSTYCI